MADTYKVAGNFKAGTWLNPEDGITYSKRRTVTVYEYGNPYPIEQFYEYGGSILATPTPIDNPLLDPIPGEFGVGDTGDTPITESPRGDVGGYDPLTSGEQALYTKYMEYLNYVDSYNEDLKWKLEIYYDGMKDTYGWTETEKNKVILNEMENKQLKKYPFDTWYQLSQDGTVQQPEFWDMPPLEVEKWYEKDVIPWQKGTQAYEDFSVGAKKMWGILDATGVPRILAMRLAGMPPELTASMIGSTLMYGSAQRIMGRQDELTSSLSNIADQMYTAQGETDTAESWKLKYIQLNEQAKRRGIITGDWKLRLSRNLPIKERWKRLYVTLLDYITEHT
jgi:hypothetical protein